MTRADRDVDTEEAGRVDPAAAEALARTVVLRKLTARAQTRHELAEALTSKGIPDTVTVKVLDAMAGVGLVDDAAFARDWIASRQQRRQLSRPALRRELTIKGVDPELIDRALAEVDIDDEYAAARSLAERRLATLSGQPREVAYRRIAGALARRGFSAGLVSRVLADVLPSSSQSALAAGFDPAD